MRPFNHRKGKRMKFSKVCAFLATGLLGLSAVAHAELVTVRVSATVVNVDDPGNAFGGAVQVGDEVTGTYTFDTTTSDADPNSDFGHYRHAPGVGGFDLSVGGILVQTDPQASNGLFAVDVINNQDEEGYHVVSMDNLLPLANGANLWHASVDLHSWSDTNIFDSDQLPLNPPNPEVFDDRSLHAAGDAGGHYFSFEAKVESLAIEGEPSGDENTGAYSIVASVMDVYDPADVLQGQVRIEDEIAGSYQLEPSLTDQNPDPDWAEYKHPLEAGYGFELSLNNLTFSSDSASSAVHAFVADSEYNDHYEIMSSASVTNGNFVLNDIFLYLDDSSGEALSSTKLIQTPDLAKFQGPRDVFISGESSDGSNYFYIRAEVVLITAAAATEPGLLLLPASGKFLPTQVFDLGIALDPGDRPVGIEGSVNGQNRNSWFEGCDLRSGSTTSDNYFFICPQVNYLLDSMSDTSTLDITVHLENGETRSGEVQWEILRN